MEFELQIWKISRLLNEYEAGNIELNPPYQRNPVWTLTAQQSLLKSVLSGKALPNFFLLNKGEGTYEMVDGQQRARTLIAYWKNVLVDHDSLTFEQRLAKSGDRESTKRSFLNYKLSVTVVTKVSDNETVEEYYALLNSSGLRLNRPELKKAEYFQTNFLKLVMDLAADERFAALKIFSASSSVRMNDVDFVSELVALLRFGITDKKEKVDELYEDDVKLGEMKTLKARFERNLDRLILINNILPLIRTRYKQKNDFFTLFYFYDCLRDSDSFVWEHMYRILIRLGPYIRPSQYKCEPLREYAHHCVTQSNSKAARITRHEILWAICCNQEQGLNPTQAKIADFFDLKTDCLTHIGNYWTFDPGILRDPYNQEFDFSEDEV